MIFKKKKRRASVVEKALRRDMYRQHSSGLKGEALDRYMSQQQAQHNQYMSANNPMVRSAKRWIIIALIVLAAIIIYKLLST